MPHSQQTENAQPHVTPLFLGIPKNAALPAVVGAQEQWAKDMAQKARRASGDETYGVSVVRIGEPALKVPIAAQPAEGGDEAGGATASVMKPGVTYRDTEPVVLVYYDSEATEGKVPSWVGELDARVVDRPEAQVIPSSHHGMTPRPDEEEKKNGQSGKNGQSSVFEASLGSAGTFALVAGGFAATYYFFGRDNNR